MERFVGRWEDHDNSQWEAMPADLGSTVIIGHRSLGDVIVTLTEVAEYRLGFGMVNFIYWIDIKGNKWKDDSEFSYWQYLNDENVKWPFGTYQNRKAA